MSEDCPNGLRAPVGQTERRKTPRVPIRRLAYLNLGPYDNGGVVTDISKDGLRFQMVNPVEQGGIVPISILLGAANEVDAVGDIVWMDTDRKVGGVRFTVSPQGAAERIIEWASEGTEISEAEPTRADVQDTSISIERFMERWMDAAPPASTRATGAGTGGAPPIPNIPPIPVPSPRTPAAAQPSAPVLLTPPAVRTSPAAPDNRPTASMQSSDVPPAPPMIPQPSSIPGMYQQPQAMAQQPSAMPWITHFDPYPPARDSAFFRGVLGGIAICALFAFAAWFAMRYYGWQNPLALLGSFGNSGVANRDLSGAPAPTPLAPNPVTPAPAESNPSAPLPAAQAPSEGNPNSASVTGRRSPPVPADSTAPVSEAPSPETVPAATAAEKPQSAVTAPPNGKPASSRDAAGGASQNSSAQGQTNQATLNTTVPAEEPSHLPGAQYSAAAASAQPQRAAADAGEAQLQLARQYLDGRGRPRNPAVASQLLWSAVEKGNSAAEMDLADLYLHGDGVTRNCDQARVLLSVASQKGNAEATHKLSDLNRTGCR